MSRFNNPREALLALEESLQRLRAEEIYGDTFGVQAEDGFVEQGKAALCYLLSDGPEGPGPTSGTGRP